MRATHASFQPCPAMPRRHPTLIPALRAALLRVPLAAIALFALPAHADHAATTDTAPRQDQATALAGVEVTAPIARDSDSVTKTDTPIIEIPQSVSVITGEQMRVRGIQGIEEVVWYTAGAQGGGYGPDSRSDWLLVRGFTPARYLDGLALAAGSGTGITRIEPYGLERLEVLKGPSSVVYGAMPPGGMLNMVS